MTTTSTENEVQTDRNLSPGEIKPGSLEDKITNIQIEDNSEDVQSKMEPRLTLSKVAKKVSNFGVNW
jgi:hypothetical protein